MFHKKVEEMEGNEYVKRHKGREKGKISVTDGKLITFVVLGDRKVGKTSLISRFIDKFFSPNYVPTVEDCYFKNYHDKTQETTYNLRLIDTSGHYHFPAMQRLNIAHADVILLVYEVRNVRSMKRVIQLHSVVKEELTDCATTPVICVGNKIDKTRDTDNYEDEIMQKFLHRNSSALFRHILTSAKLDINVTDIFQLGLDMIQQHNMRQLQRGSASTSFQEAVLAKMKFSRFQSPS